MMSHTNFYKAIEAAWKESNGDWRLHDQTLRRILATWTLPELIEFCTTQNDVKRRAFTPAIYNAAFMVWDGALGMDGFLDFTDLLSVTPRVIFETVIHDPDRLIEVPALWNPADTMFWLIPYQVFDEQRKAKKRAHLLENYLPPDDPPADLWARLEGHPDRAAAKQMLPKLYARFGENAFEGR